MSKQGGTYVKQGDGYFKIIAIALAVLIGLYAILTVVNRNRSAGYILEVASLCEVGDGVSVSGFVVRSEQVITGSESIMVYELGEGERVGAGQTVATGYRSVTARDNREELANLNAQLTQLQAASEEINAGTTVQQDDDILALIVGVAQANARHDPDAAHRAADRLQPMVLRSYVSEKDMESINRRITQLHSEIDGLMQQAEQGGTAVVSPEAGYFSHLTDGFESNLTPEQLEYISAAELRQLKPATMPSNSVGRVILGQKWYFVTQVPAETAERCATGSYLTVNFPSEELQGLRMVIERIGEKESDGSRVLVLSYNKLMQEVTSLRSLSADVIFESNSGLYVPASAIYHEDDETGVYVLVNTRAKWKRINVLCQYGEGYLVEYDPSKTNNLWPGDEIIVTSDYIENGSVLQ